MDNITRILYKAIKKYIELYGYSPSYRELAMLLVLSTSTIHDRMKKLKDLGYIDYTPSKSRTVRIIKDLEE